MSDLDNLPFLKKGKAMAVLIWCLLRTCSARVSGLMIAFGLFWAALCAPKMASAADELPDGVVDLGTNPETGIRRFKVGKNADVYQILGTSRYPSEVSRAYLEQVGEPLTLTAVQTQNPGQVFLSCFNAAKTGIERYSVRTNDFSPWEGCPEERRHLALKAGTTIGIQLKKVPTLDRKRDVGDAAFRALDTQDPKPLISALRIQSAWFGKGAAVVSAFDGESFKNAEIAMRIAQDRAQEASVAEQRANDAESALAAALVRASAERDRLVRGWATTALAGAALCLALFIGWLVDRRRTREALARRAEIEALEHQQAESRYNELSGRHDGALRELRETYEAISRAFDGRTDAPLSAKPVDRIAALAVTAQLAERREVTALGELATARDRLKASELQVTVAVQDVGSLRGLVQSLYGLACHMSRALEKAACWGEVLAEPSGVKSVSERLASEFVPLFTHCIVKVNARLGALINSGAVSGPSAAGDRRRSEAMLRALGGLPDQRLDEKLPERLGQLFDKLSAASAASRCEADLRRVIEPWVRAEAHLAGRTVPDLSGLSLLQLVEGAGSVVDRLLYMQNCVEKCESRPLEPEPAVSRRSHPTDIAELAPQGVFQRMLRDVKRLLEFFEKGSQEVCVLSREDVPNLVRAFAAERFSLAPGAPLVSLFRLLGATPSPGLLPSANTITAAQ